MEALIPILIAAVVTAVLIWVVQQGGIPVPFSYIVWAVIVIIWLVLLLRVTNVGRTLA